MARLRASLAAPALALICGLGLSAPVLAADCRPDRVELRGSWGQTSFSVEIADDEAERAQGLMFRESMARGAGMLFVYSKPQRVAFWMKNSCPPWNSYGDKLVVQSACLAKADNRANAQGQRAAPARVKRVVERTATTLRVHVARRPG